MKTQPSSTPNTHAQGPGGHHLPPTQWERPKTTPRPPAAARQGAQRQQALIGGDALRGELTLLPQAHGLVVFANNGHPHGPQHRMVARILNGYHLNTLLLDPLTSAQNSDPAHGVDIHPLMQRLVTTLYWVQSNESTRELRAGFFGTGTGAVAALCVAAQHPARVAAVVSCSGQLGLARPWLASVQAPALLVVGGQDTEALQLNRDAARELRCEWRLEVVPGATCVVGQLGAIKTVAHLCGSWFAERLRRPVH